MYGCMVESHESTRQRAESLQAKSHEDPISVTHENSVHELIPTKIPDAMAAVDKEWKKLGTIPA